MGGGGNATVASLNMTYFNRTRILHSINCALAHCTTERIVHDLILDIRLQTNLKLDLNIEALAAPTLPLRVGVCEGKFARHLSIFEVHLGSYYVHQRHGLDKNLETVSRRRYVGKGNCHALVTSLLLNVYYTRVRLPLSFPEKMTASQLKHSGFSPCLVRLACE